MNIDMYINFSLSLLILVIVQFFFVTLNLRIIIFHFMSFTVNLVCFKKYIKMVEVGFRNSITRMF